MKNIRNIIIVMGLIFTNNLMAQLNLTSEYELFLDNEKVFNLVKSKITSTNKIDSALPISDFVLDTHISEINETIATEVAGVEFEFTSEAQIESLNNNEYRLKINIKKLSIYIDKIETHHQILRRVGSSYIKTNIDGLCENIKMESKNGLNYNSFIDMSYNVQGGVLALNYSDLILNKQEGSLGLSNISCSGIKGFEEVVSTELMNKLNDVNFIKSELEKYFLSKIGVISQKVEDEILKPADLGGHKDKLVVKSYPQSLEGFEDGISVKGLMVFNFKTRSAIVGETYVALNTKNVPLNEGLKKDCRTNASAFDWQEWDSMFGGDSDYYYEDVPLGSEIFAEFCDYTKSLKSDSSGFSRLLLPYGLLDKVAAYMHHSQMARFQTDTKSISGLKKLMKSRWTQFFVFRDLMNFPKRTNFYLFLSTEDVPQVSSVYELSQQSLGFEIQSKLVLDMFAPINGQWEHYLNFYSQVYTPVKLDIDQANLNFNFLKPDLDLTYRFDKEYMSKHKVKKRISTDTLKEHLVDAIDGYEYSIDFSQLTPLKDKLKFTNIVLDEGNLSVGF
ncbi:MAG: hypothetical protein HOO06_15125 [Bdellovibrionaceae bacterium]|jgi:hypothetical protein|nr:hypothetical protein [Pseudobdellovibrionaceae bacterium]